MKIRNGFVSNSSSSSFIVYNDKEKDVDYSQYKKYFKEEDYPYAINPCYSIVLPLGRKSKLKSFGWEFRKRCSFEDKVNFLLLQLKSLEDYLYVRNKSFNEMYYTIKDSFYGAMQLLLEKTLNTRDCYLDVKIDYNAIEGNSIYENYIYIDHQSLWTDDYDSDRLDNYIQDFNINLPWLFDKRSILNYLVGDSYIQTGNDNEEGTEEYYESLKLNLEYIKKNIEDFKETHTEEESKFLKGREDEIY